MPVELADRLSAATPRILYRYETALTDGGSPLLRNDISRGEVLAHAEQLLQDLIDDFAGEHAATTRRTLAVDIGSSRAAQGFHPGESLRAAGVLFSLVMDELTRPGAGQLATVEETLSVALAMNGVLVRAVGAAADSYAAFQLDRIHSAHVEERRRVSRELHDRVGHCLNLAYRSLEFYQIQHERDPLTGTGRVSAAAEALRELLDLVPKIISDLRASEPVDSLEKSLRYFLDSADHPDIAVHLQVTGDEYWAAPRLRDDAFLIIREAMRNTFTHAQASALLVRVRISPDDLHATVRDDGVGFSPTTATKGRAGLISVRERAELLGGTATVTSAPGRGTTIELHIPF